MPPRLDNILPFLNHKSAAKVSTANKRAADAGKHYFSTLTQQKYRSGLHAAGFAKKKHNLNKIYTKLGHKGLLNNTHLVKNVGSYLKNVGPDAKLQKLMSPYKTSLMEYLKHRVNLNKIFNNNNIK